MIFDLLTGLLSVILIAFSLSYVLRRQFNKKSITNKLKFHCLSGYAAILIVLLHIRMNLFDWKCSAGFISFAALLLIALTGFLKRRFRKKRIFYWIHVALAVIFGLALLLHIGHQIIYLLLI